MFKRYNRPVGFSGDIYSGFFGLKLIFEDYIFRIYDIFTNTEQSPSIYTILVIDPKNPFEICNERFKYFSEEALRESLKNHCPDFDDSKEYIWL